MKSFLFTVRIILAWVGSALLLLILWEALTGKDPPWIFPVLFWIMVVVVAVRVISHVRHVRLVSNRVDGEALGSRHRRQIEIPYAAAEAFELVDGAIRELPLMQSVESVRDSLQIRGRTKPKDPYTSGRNRVRATVTPGEGTSSLVFICEPEGGAWVDWFLVDDGVNLENAEAVTRAVMRRVSERRKVDQADARQTATEKELTVAKLSLLHAQVEPHFLYNTLASAQILTRSDPARADQMLGNLITYLRHSLPRTEDSLSTLGEELERTRSYLEILRIRMGERLNVQIQVPEHLKSVPMPAMMLQTLAENAIKHGLEPVVGGGTLWVLAREADGKVAVTVADDGRGFNESGGGTGIGLKNVRERLRLAYGDAASFNILANFPKGVAATITLPVAPTPAGAQSHA
jgi:signal transduction histidine kinase